MLFFNGFPFFVGLFDIFKSISRIDLWLYLSWTDIKLRYRGSTLGIFWNTASFLIFILLIGLVYSHIFKISVKEYLPYLTVSYLIWNFISIVIQESPDTFIQNKYLIHQTNLSYAVYPLRVLMRNIFIFLHNFLVFIGVAIYFHLPFHLNTIIYFIPGFLLLCLILFLILFNLGLLGARYRDTVPIIASVLQLLFFISPIMYKSNFFKDNLAYLNYNPIIYLLDIVRSPLLNTSIMPISWIYCTLIALVLFIIYLISFYYTNKKIALWI